MPDTKPLTGYPSVDKPWLKYYSEEAINAPLPECSIYEYLYENNKDYPGRYCHQLLRAQNHLRRVVRQHRPHGKGLRGARRGMYRAGLFTAAGRK